VEEDVAVLTKKSPTKTGLIKNHPKRRIEEPAP
jgi:hypothetical protein